MAFIKLERRRGEGFFIGRDIHVLVKAIYPDVIEIVIDAPRPIAVSRDNDGPAAHMRRQERLDAEQQPAPAGGAK